VSFLYSRQLEHFLTVYASLSLRGAAEKSGLSQPALSKSLRSLEERLQVSLFERMSTGVMPTEAAHILHRYASTIVNDARYAEMEISALRLGLKGTLKIGAGVTWSLTHMPKVLAEFHQKYPSIHLKLVTGISDQLRPRLEQGDIDVLVCDLGGVEVPGDFEVWHSWPTEMTPFARSGHPVLEKRPIMLRDLLAYDWAGFADDERFTRAALAYFGGRGLRPPVVSIEMTSLATMLSVVRVSNHIAVIADALHREAASRGLEVVRLNEPLWKIETAVVFRRQIASLDPVRYLLDEISKISSPEFAI
jgi:DNA-binding transcriptional LysR family regulator